jgi:hypothetical protein
MSRPSELATSLYALVESGNLEALQRIAPADFDWATLDDDDLLPPLHLVVRHALASKISLSCAVDLTRWLIGQGANPAQCAPLDNDGYWEIWKRENKKDSIIKVEYAGESAISFLSAFIQQMRENPKDEYWVETGRVDLMHDVGSVLEAGHLLNALTEAPVGNSKRNVQTVDASVVSMWEDVLADEACQDLTFECEGGSAVGAHALVLSCASPVLRAMVSSRMREGNERKIEVHDSSEAAVKLFLELVYTGGSSADPLRVLDALSALDLAHRWEVLGVVGMLERAITPLIWKTTFSVIAEAAVLKDLPLLKSSCVQFAQKRKSTVDELAEKGELSPAVLSLIGKRVSASGEPAAKKPRRSF